jgi:hypothetical protein
MTRRLIFLNLALLIAAGALGRVLLLRWRDAQARERAIFTQAARAKAVLAPPPLPVPPAVMASNYLVVAQQMLFSKDRNPNVAVEAPPPPKPKPPLPALPFYFGQMNFGEPTVLMSVGNGDQKSYRAGDKVGPFELVSFDRDKIKLAWNGETVERGVNDLRPKEPVPQTFVPAAAPAPPEVKSLGAPPQAAPDKGPALGVEMGGDFRACVMGDTSPAGTVLNGYRKVVATTLMGQSCHWERIK